MAAYTFGGATEAKEWQVGRGTKVNVSGVATWGDSYFYIQQYFVDSWYSAPAGNNYHVANFSYTFDWNGDRRLRGVWTYGGGAPAKAVVDVQAVKQQVRS